MNQQEQNNNEKKLEVRKRQHEHSEENQNNYEKKLEVKKKRKHEHSKENQNNYKKKLDAWISFLFQNRFPEYVYVYFDDKTTVNDDENKYEKNTEVRRRKKE